jgi:hypothetical protein
MALIYAQRCDREEDKNLCNCIVAISIGVFFVFFAFRGYVYTDWASYSEAYKNVSWNDILSITSNKQTAVIREPGYTLLMCICRIFSDEYAFLVVVITTIDTLLLIRFLKHWDIRNVPFVLMLFVAFQGVTIVFNLLRNQIAIFIFINLIEYILEKKTLKYYLGCLIALCFHSSSLLYFPLYFFVCRKLNKWLFVLAFFLFFSFFMSHISLASIAINFLNIGGVISEKILAYTEMFGDERILSITGTIEKISLVGLTFLFYEELTKKKRNIILINCLLINYFFYYMFAEFQMMSYRMFLLFEFPYWVLWIEILNLVKIPNNKRLVALFIFTLCFYIQINDYIEPIQEYDNLLLGGKSQAERLRIREKTMENLK